MKTKLDIDAIVSNAVEEQFRKDRQKEYMRRVLKTSYGLQQYIYYALLNNY